MKELSGILCTWDALLKLGLEKKYLSKHPTPACFRLTPDILTFPEQFVMFECSMQPLSHQWAPIQANTNGCFLWLPQHILRCGKQTFLRNHKRSDPGNIKDNCSQFWSVNYLNNCNLNLKNFWSHEGSDLQYAREITLPDFLMSPSGICWLKTVSTGNTSAFHPVFWAAPAMTGNIFSFRDSLLEYYFINFKNSSHPTLKEINIQLETRMG